MAKNALDEIKKHQEAIEALKAEAVTALQEQRRELTAQLGEIDRQIEELTGKPPRAGRGTKSSSGKTSYNFGTLVAILEKADKKETPIRAINGDSKEIRAIVAANPKSLKIIENGPHPRVKLL